MAAGIQVTKEEINNAAGSIARSVFTVMDDVAQFKAWLDGLTAQNLVDLYGFTLGDANILKSAFTDLGGLASVFTGAAAQTPAKDFRVFARQLLGTGLY